MWPVGLKGNRPLLFFRSTSDLRTASRPTARWAALPRVLRETAGREEGRPASNKPARIFTVRMRVTASSSRAIGIVPSLTCANREAKSPFQLSGAMYMSTPASKASGQSVAVQPGISACPFQSPITKPLKPISRRSTLVSRDFEPCIFSPFTLEKEAITV